ncbi:integral membrane protein GPR137C isoform X1 [Scleropages formosus]|uniref:G protein-coupled receptor 137c n=1 Tax=Scleropages formosus TaxID=113540 RepID=A0A8C9SVE6_SCLFO|nr:integral membrane protein GPR137C isoform X1 [Scleropages formosus]XP_018583321.1 integral membrane protein GPR137C isoform X1 [Scleropages formosus]
MLMESQVTDTTVEPIRAAVPPSVELGLTVVYTVLYSLLFVFVYLQLWLILHYGHKRFSYQSVFLFFCLLWSALRTTLFSFYFRNVVQANELQPLPYWLLYCFPVCLQFFTLCLLNLYFAQVMFKAKAKYSPELNKYKIPLHLAFLFASLFFLVVNMTCAMLVQGHVGEGEVKHSVLVRVLINDSLFVLCAISLAFCIFKVAKMSSANVYLESKGTSVCQATAIGAMVILLYMSRACYNLVVVSLSPEDRPNPFNYGWYNVSDQADVEKINGAAYVVFGIILFFWELLPTSLVVIFFRVQRPNQNLTPGGMINSHSFSSRAYFFDNPRRYDSDDDLSRSVSSRGERGSSILSSTSQPGPSWYGSIQRNSSLTAVPHLLSGPPAATAPLLLAYSNIQTNQHHNYYSTPQNYYATPQNFYSTPQNETASQR